MYDANIIKLQLKLENKYFLLGFNHKNPPIMDIVINYFTILNIKMHVKKI